jgi:hypothetical protein
MHAIQTSGNCIGNVADHFTGATAERKAPPACARRLIALGHPR